MPEPDAVLDHLRTRLLTGKKAGKAAVPWQPPLPADFAPVEEMLAFDPSLNDFGWVALTTDRTSVTVLDRGSIRPLTDETGYLGMWRRSSLLTRELWDLRYEHFDADYVACEAPLVGAGMRKESSEIAGTIAYLIFHQRGFAGVAARHASSVLCGNPRHDKGEIRDAVARYVPEAATRKWNQGQRDALAVGLTCLWDLAHPSPGK